jgi:hypothetical protein
MYDVGSMLISVNVPGNLINVFDLLKKTKGRNKTFNWYVSNPINNVNINIGDYVSFSEKYKGEKEI